MKKTPLISSQNELKYSVKDKFSPIQRELIDKIWQNIINLSLLRIDGHLKLSPSKFRRSCSSYIYLIKKVYYLTR